jgi:pyrophosphatase PpaX
MTGRTCKGRAGKGASRDERIRYSAMTSGKAAVLFDLDGTLIDSIGLILQSARHAFDRLACPWPGDDVWMRGVGIPLRTQAANHATGGWTADQFIEAYREYQNANHDRLVVSYPGIPELVNELRARGHPLAVVTSKADALAERGLRVAGLRDAFDTVVGCDSCARHKPDPEPVHVALERLGASANEAIFVGDSVHDVESGKGAGVVTVAALWGPFSRETLAHAEPRHFAERPEEIIHIVGQ